jgi:hypothetical protein
MHFIQFDEYLDSPPEQVLVFEKSDNTVRVSRPDYNTLGASINKITLKTFDKNETIGIYAQQRLDRISHGHCTYFHKLNDIPTCTRKFLSFENQTQYSPKTSRSHRNSDPRQPQWCEIRVSPL